MWRGSGAALALAAALAGALACARAPRVPTLATALLAAGAPAPDRRHIGTPPWARLVGMWGAYPMTHGSIEAVAFVGNDRLVTLNESDGSLRVWDVPTRALLVRYDGCPLPHERSTRAFWSPNRYLLALSADGRLAAVGHGFGDVCVRRLSDGAIVGTIDAGPSLRHLGFVETSHVVTYTHALPDPVAQVLPRPDPSAPPPPPDGFLRVWDLGGRLVSERLVGDLPSDDRARAEIAASTGSRVAVPLGNELLALDLPAMRVAWSRRLGGAIFRVGFSSGDRFLVEWASPGPPRSARVTELALADGRELGTADVPRFELVALDPRGPGAVVREAVEPGGDPRPFREVQLWDVPRMKLRKTATRTVRVGGCPELSLPLGEGVFSPDGSVLATAYDGVALWDVERLAPLPPGPGHCGGVWRLALSPDASRALSVGGGTVRLWRVADWAELRRWPGNGSAVATFSPDGARILLGGSAVSVLDAETGKVIWEVSDRAGPAAFTPDGAHVATVGRDHDLTMHDAGTGRVLWRHEPRMSGSSVLAFTPDGKRLVADTATSQLAVWDVRTGRLIRDLGRHAEQKVAMRADAVLVFQQARDAVLLPVDGGAAIVRPNVSLGYPSFVLTPDGRHAFALERDHVTLTRLDDGANLGEIDLLPFDDGPTSADLSRDGRRLLVGTRRGVLLNFEIAPL
jgi:WD40 repeat protein